LPFRIVLFAHFNPVDQQAGFAPEAEGAKPAPADRDLRGPSGTDDLLLYKELVEALGTVLLSEAQQDAPLERRFRLLRRGTGGRVRLAGPGEPLFDEQGRRRRGTGEHVLYLRPEVVQGRILPRATLEVHAANPGRGSLWSWQRIRVLELGYGSARDAP